MTGLRRETVLPTRVNHTSNSAKEGVGETSTFSMKIRMGSFSDACQTRLMHSWEIMKTKERNRKRLTLRFLVPSKKRSVGTHAAKRL